MKVSSLFNLISCATDVLDFFEGVATSEQLVSRLERLKRQGTEDLLPSLEELRESISDTLDDTLEMSASLDDDEGEEDDLLSDKELSDLVSGHAEEEDEKQNPPEEEPPQEEKNPVT